MRETSRAAALAVMIAAATVTAATACGAGSGHAAAGPGPAHGTGATRSTAAAAKPGAPSPVTGAQLKSLLPTQAELPPGWVLSQRTGQETDSGSVLARGPYFPTLPKLSCTRSRGVDPQSLLSDDQASGAQLTVVVGHNKNTSLGSINLAGYYPGWAARQFGLISSLARHRCGAFTKRDEITGALVKMKPTVTAVSGLGDQALLLKIIQANGPLPDGTYYPGQYLLVFRAGSYLADVDVPAIPGQSPGKAVNTLGSLLARRLGQLS